VVKGKNPFSLPGIETRPSTAKPVTILTESSWHRCNIAAFVRCSSRSSVSEHLMGPSMSVRLSVTIFATLGPEFPLLELIIAQQ
jgi:hypothetical protein